MSLDEGDLHGLERASAQLAELVRADTAWTELVAGPDHPVVLSVDLAARYVAGFETMRNDIDSAVQAGNEIRTVTVNAAQMDPVYAGPPPASLADALQAGGALAALEDVLEEAGSLQTLAEQGAAGMKDSRDEAMELLLSDLRAVISGGPSPGWGPQPPGYGPQPPGYLSGHSPGPAPGYLPDRFLCGLAKASITAGLITVWVPPHAHAAAAVGLGVAVYKAAKCSGKASPAPPAP